MGYLLASHHVTIADVEEIPFGVDGEDPDYRHLRDRFHLRRLRRNRRRCLLVIALEPISPGYFRPFAARDMEPKERRACRSRKRTR
jgi:hypothetical protein